MWKFLKVKKSLGLNVIVRCQKIRPESLITKQNFDLKNIEILHEDNHLLLILNRNFLGTLIKNKDPFTLDNIIIF